MWIITVFNCIGLNVCHFRNGISLCTQWTETVEINKIFENMWGNKSMTLSETLHVNTSVCSASGVPCGASEPIRDKDLISPTGIFSKSSHFFSMSVPVMVSGICGISRATAPFFSWTLSHGLSASLSETASWNHLVLSPNRFSCSVSRPTPASRWLVEGSDIMSGSSWDGLVGSDPESRRSGWEDPNVSPFWLVGLVPLLNESVGWQRYFFSFPKHIIYKLEVTVGIEKDFPMSSIPQSYIQYAKYFPNSSSKSLATFSPFFPEGVRLSKRSLDYGLA